MLDSAPPLDLHYRSRQAPGASVSFPFAPVSMSEQAPRKTVERRPSIIPPTHDNRTLVLCFDGTGDQFDGDNSNIVHFCSLLKKDDRSQQLVYYQVRLGFCGATLALMILLDRDRDDPIPKGFSALDKLDDGESADASAT